MQDNSIIEVDSDIQKQLLEREKVLLRVRQSRICPGGSAITPISIYITNMRVIYRKPIWGGLKSDIINVNYQDIVDIRLKRGIIHTGIFLKSRFHPDEIAVKGTNSNIAEKANAFIQRGIRGERTGQAMYRQPQQTPNYYNYSQEEGQSEDIASKMDPVDKLAKLADLKQKGFLTDDEFQRLKIKLLKKI
ncbi:MAG: SHOCT domain-containing protein [Candidatus Nitrosopolaris sp.]